MFSKKILKNSLFSTLGCTKAYTLTKPFYSGIGHILVLHRVCEKSSAKRLPMCSGLEITPAYLEKVIRFFLDRQYDVISLDQLRHRLQAGKTGRKFVVFTFDDGYIDNMTHAYPIFKKYHIPFTIYVTTGFVNRSAILWWYLLEDLLLENDSIKFVIEGKTFEYDCAALSQKEKTFLDIRAIIAGSHENNYWERIKQIFTLNRIDIHKKTEELILNWRQVRELSSDPLVTIGSHALNHYCLTHLSEDGARREILESKRMLEAHVNYEINHFSYPFGDKHEAEIREFRIARECGFQTATTSRSANIFPAHKNHLETLPRITIGESMDEQRLIFLINGLMHFKTNGFKRIITS